MRLDSLCVFPPALQPDPILSRGSRGQPEQPAEQYCIARPTRSIYTFFQHCMNCLSTPVAARPAPSRQPQRQQPGQSARMALQPAAGSAALLQQVAATDQAARGPLGGAQPQPPPQPPPPPAARLQVRPLAVGLLSRLQALAGHPTALPVGFGGESCAGLGLAPRKRCGAADLFAPRSHAAGRALHSGSRHTLRRRVRGCVEEGVCRVWKVRVWDSGSCGA